MSKKPSTLRTSHYGNAYIAHETTDKYDCRAASVQDFETESGHQTRFLTLTFNNRTGLMPSVKRALQNINHDIQPEGRRFDVHIPGSEGIVFGLKALFAQNKPGWNDYDIKTPIISPDMQEGLKEECGDFFRSAEDMPSPEDF